MNTSIAALKRSKSNLDTLIGELSKVAEPQKQKNSYADDRFWKPELDKTGNGYAVLRFLPAVKDEDLPWARLWSHAFQGPGGWFIENSLTTLNKKDPVSESNSLLWNSGVEADKDIARKRKRKLSYIANVLIVSDSKHPENEGQIKLFKFGKKIFDKITEAMKPEFEDENPINPFDFWEGANFKLKIRKVDGFWNYDKSEFDSSSAIADNDESIEEIWNKQFPLKPFLAPENFKSYDELKAKLDKVLTGSGNSGTAEDVAIPPVTEAVAPVVQETVDTSSPVDDDSDETLDYFSKLAEEDA
ncbi:MAG: single-stranded DNA-binding protein [Opitutales bacterium]|nr:single-stranded DNA-binding protein [Opitutales bacterium]|tara:strand:+ start:1249 stop:2151 length:903 start_codon:yes stop_codon:yes gene_type:complete